MIQRVRHEKIATRIQRNAPRIIELARLAAGTTDDFNKIAAEQIELIKKISEHIAGISSKVLLMTEERKKANKLSGQKAADAYCDKVKPYFDEIRYPCDKLELLVDDELWPLTKYRELLFTK